jgi:5'-3' exonuclease
MKNVIIDGNNVACIAYYRARSSVLTPEFETKDVEKSLFNFSVYVFFNIFHKIIKEHKGSNIYVIWDGREGSAWRKVENTDYKGNRNKSIEYFNVLYLVLDKCREMLVSYPIVQFQKLDAEADDLMYSLCKLLNDDENEIISTDSDLIQLAQQFKNVKVWNPIKKIFHVVPSYDYVTYKSIVGDKSDNITGLNGYGPKKAEKATESKLGALSPDQKKVVKDNLLLIDLSRNPQVEENNEYIKNSLASYKINMNLDRIKKDFFDLKIKSFIDKWDSIVKFLHQLNTELINGRSNGDKTDIQ